MTNQSQVWKVMVSASAANESSRWESQPERASGADSAEDRLQDELKTCRALASRCAFVIGPARSGTTILAQMINANHRAFLTTEANFHMAGAHPVFRDWYNNQHKMFGNQISKSCYAPNFGFAGENQWWKWLARAADHFELVGDQMAFSDLHIQIIDTHDFMSFFEARFFRSKYIFTFRDPVQAVISSAMLWNKSPVSLIAGWAAVVRLWADLIRIFPSTMTVLLEDLDAARIAKISTFLQIDLTESEALLDPRELRRHNPADIASGEVVEQLAPRLQMIYHEIRETVAMERVLLQTDQKRERDDGSQRHQGGSPSDIALVSSPVGRAWNLADQLVGDLQGSMGGELDS
jgi:hypothetical protein